MTGLVGLVAVSLVVGVDYTLGLEAFHGSSSRCDELGRFDIQWGPADVQPLVLSPKVWMWKPRLALGSWPAMSKVMVVASDSEACSKVTVPATLESPRRTATGDTDHGQHELSSQ